MEMCDLRGKHYEVAADLLEGYSARHIAQRLRQPEHVARQLIAQVYEKLSVDDHAGLVNKVIQQRWARTHRMLLSFIAEFGHSDIPESDDEDLVWLRGMVEALRWAHGPAAPGSVRHNPFPGIDWVAELERTPGWTW